MKEPMRPSDEELLAALSATAREIRRENDARQQGLPPLPEGVKTRILAHAERRKVARLRPRVLAAMLAAAAVVLLFVFFRPRSHFMPPYSLEVEGSQSMMRDAPRAAVDALRVADEGPVTLVARPAERPHDAVQAFLFGMRDGAVVPLEADVKVSVEGSVRMEVGAGMLHGFDEVRVVVAKAPTDIEEALQRAKRGDALTIRIEHASPARQR